MIVLALVLIGVIGLFACNFDAYEQSQNNAQPAFFIGEVIEICESGCLLKVTDEGNFGKLAVGTTIQVTTNIENSPEYALGDYLKVKFDGTVAESYPPQVIHVLGIKKIDSTGESIK